MAFVPADGLWVEELLAELGPLSIRRMFGAAGVYIDGLMFGIIDDGVFYLRTDAQTVGGFMAAGARQFTYPARDGGEVATSYWSLPDAAADDPDEAVRWAREAIEASRRKVGPKRPKKGR